MKVVLVSNFYNHHQKPLADAMYSKIGSNYHFIETKKIDEERLKMGWGGEEKPPYVLQSYTSPEAMSECQNIIDNADVVIVGNAPYKIAKTRLKKGLLTFMYTERIYKNGTPILKLPIHFLRSLKRYISHRNFYVLCASAYTPLDFSRTFAFIGKTYKWGYFTEVKRYDDIDKLIDNKMESSIVWVSRFIPLKHPEIPLEIAKRLKNDGYNFHLAMIGNGELENQIKDRIEKEELSDCVEMLGAMTPAEVRRHMEKSEIFLFTSDRNEGWGAVINEAMNSACAVVANSAVGSVPFLLVDGENGYMYKDGVADDVYQKVKSLLDDSEERRRIGKNAYKTMTEEWNAENASNKLIALCEKMLSGEYKPFPYESGVCSKAKILKDKWYK